MSLGEMVTYGLLAFFTALLINCIVHSSPHGDAACDGKLHSVLSHGNTDYYWTCVDGKVIYLTHER